MIQDVYSLHQAITLSTFYSGVCHHMAFIGPNDLLLAKLTSYSV